MTLEPWRNFAFDSIKAQEPAIRRLGADFPSVLLLDTVEGPSILGIEPEDVGTPAADEFVYATLRSLLAKGETRYAYVLPVGATPEGGSSSPALCVALGDGEDLEVWGAKLNRSRKIGRWKQWSDMEGSLPAMLRQACGEGIAARK